MHPVRRIALALLTCAALAAPGLAFQGLAPGDRPPPRLATYLAVQRSATPNAVVTGKFDDWRTVSKYRRRAGLHLGYDVAVPRGSPVLAGWAGVVARIVPWTDTECGVTVRDADGYEATYGHVRPLVAAGTAVAAGEVVGRTVIDHVDIKMRGPDGLYYDFGRDAPRVAAANPDPAETLRRYLRAKYSVELTREEAERIVIARRRARQTVERSRAAVERAGLSERVDDAVEQARRTLERWGRRDGEPPDAPEDADAEGAIQPDVPSDLDRVLQEARRQLNAARRELERLGLPVPR